MQRACCFRSLCSFFHRFFRGRFFFGLFFRFLRFVVHCRSVVRFLRRTFFPILLSGLCRILFYDGWYFIFVFFITGSGAFDFCCPEIFYIIMSIPVTGTQELQKDNTCNDCCSCNIISVSFYGLCFSACVEFVSMRDQALPDPASACFP